MAKVAHFYGWTFADIRAMTMREFDWACDYIVTYQKAQTKA